MKYQKELQDSVSVLVGLALIGQIRLSPELFLELCNLESATIKSEIERFEKWLSKADTRLCSLRDQYYKSDITDPDTFGSPNDFYLWTCKNTNMVDWLEQHLPPVDLETSIGFIQAFRERDASAASSHN